MNKPKIFIHMHYLEIGGAESALIGLLNSLDPKKVNVDLFLNEHRGEMMRFIPDWINVLPPVKEYTVIEQPLIKAILKFQLGVVLGRLFAKVKFNIYKRKYKPKDDFAIFGFIGKYLNRFLPSLENLGNYDLAISFLTPHNVVADKVKAKRKICWIHTDYSSVDPNIEIEYSVWNSYHRIVSISDKVSEAFCKKFPSLGYKILNIENILPGKFITDRACEFLPSEFVISDEDEISLLSIGRFCDAKNFEIIPYITRYLLDRGIKLKWFIIGYGTTSAINNVKAEIKGYKVEKEVILLGKKDNPYPYIKACDWYVQPSKYEGKSITVREAQFLGKPVIIRNYPTAKSQVIDKFDGLIAEFDKEEFAQNLAEYLKDEKTKEKIEVNLKKIDFSFFEEVKKIYDLLK